MNGVERIAQEISTKNNEVDIETVVKKIKELEAVTQEQQQLIKNLNDTITVLQKPLEE